MNANVDRWLRTLATAMVLCVMVGGSLLLCGSALSRPPSAARGYEFSANTTVVPNGSDVTADFRTPQLGPTQSLLVINDNAGGGSDLLVSLSGATAAAPGSTAASTSFRVKPGNQFNIDGTWVQCVLRGDTATCSARLVVTY